MPQNITDVDEFTATLTEAADGDDVSGAVRLTHMQKVANRSRFLYNRSLQIAQYTVSASGIANAALLGLSSPVLGQGTWTLASNEVEVPAAGLYLISAGLIMSSTDTANPKVISTDLEIGGTAEYVQLVTRFSGTAGNQVDTYFSWLKNITTPSTQKIRLKNTSGTGSYSANGVLLIKRVG